MTIREVENRIADRDLYGLIILHPLTREIKVVRFISPNTIWLVSEDTFPNGKIEIIEVSLEEFYSWEVKGHKTKNILMEGDIIVVDARQYGLGENEKGTVETVCEGSAAPYPIRVKFSDRRGQFKHSDCKIILKAR